MARTQGHGNPKWTRDETILALDLYFELNGKVPGPDDSRVLALSQLLRRFPYHSEASRQESFRNPDGVAFKLQNIRQVATGKGLGNVSEMDRAVWQELGERPHEVRALARGIRSGIEVAEALPDVQASGEPEFFEGRVVTELHSRRERDPKLRARLLSARQNNGGLCCEMCGARPLSDDLELQDAQFEAHHVVPLASTGARSTPLSEIALLCASCHRLLHRAIALKRRWLSIDDGRKLVSS